MDMKHHQEFMDHVNAVGKQMADAHVRHGKGHKEAVKEALAIGLQGVAQKVLDICNSNETDAEKVAEIRDATNWNLSTGIAMFVNGATEGDAPSVS